MHVKDLHFPITKPATILLLGEFNAKITREETFRQNTGVNSLH